MLAASLHCMRRQINHVRIRKIPLFNYTHIELPFYKHASHQMALLSNVHTRNFLCKLLTRQDEDAPLMRREARAQMRPCSRLRIWCVGSPPQAARILAVEKRKHMRRAGLLPLLSREWMHRRLPCRVPKPSREFQTARTRIQRVRACGSRGPSTNAQCAGEAASDRSPTPKEPLGAHSPRTQLPPSKRQRD